MSEEKKAVEDGFGNCVSDRVLPSKPKDGKQLGESKTFQRG